MFMTRIFSIVLLLLAGTIITQAQVIRVKGSGNITKSNRAVEPFTGITVNGGMQVMVSEGTESTVVVETDDNIQEYVDIVVKNGELLIGFKPRTSLVNTKSTIVFVTNPVLNKARVSGSGSILVEDQMVSDGNFEAAISGSGKVKANMVASSVNAKISGSGNMELLGTTEELFVAISGSGNFKGYGLASERTTAKIAGSGNVQTTIQGKLDASIAGSGSVYYKGEGNISLNTVGSGKLRKID